MPDDQTSSSIDHDKLWLKADATGINPKDLIGATKVPFQVVPWSGVSYMAFCMYDGGVKYAPLNWRDLKIKLSIYAEAGLGHFASILDGEDFDPVTGLLHAGYAMSCGAIIIDAMVTDSLIDDRFATRRARQGKFTRNPDIYPEGRPGAIKEMISKPLRLDPIGSTSSTPIPTPLPPSKDNMYEFTPKTPYEAATLCTLLNLLNEAKEKHPTDSVKQLNYIASNINGP